MNLALGGYNGRISFVDLGAGKVTYEPLSEDLLLNFIGGRGLGAKFLFDTLSRGEINSQDPLGIFVGPLSGTGFPLANRLTIVFRSPLTRTIAYTHTGGYAGTALKLAGLDAIVVTGNSPSPRYLLVRKDEVLLLDAQSIWGMKATDCMNALRAKHGDARILSIGPAGENLVKYANVVNDSGRASGVRHGSGCLLGVKKLKAIVIQSDYSQRLPIANKQAFKEIMLRVSGKIRNSPLLNRETGSFSLYGTPLAVEPLNSSEALPVKNYRFTHFQSAEDLSGKKMSDTILISRLTCNSCPVQCRRETASLKKYNFRVEGPDYAQISSLGSNCHVYDLESVAYMNYLCYELGIDPIETGNLLAIYADATEKGLLSRTSQKKGLGWSDPERMIELIHLIAERQSEEGKLLSEGADFLVRDIGDETLSTAVKGITIQNTDPRVEPAWGLLNATENSGSSLHIWVYPDMIYSFATIRGIMLNIPKDKDDLNGIAETVKRKQDFVAALDSLQVCAFSRMAFEEKDYVDALNAAPGWEWDELGLRQAGERIFNIERAFNNRFGIGGESDKLPSKFTSQQIEEGINKGRVCRLEPMLARYYELRGWDNGIVRADQVPSDIIRAQAA
jgi:aldehyde:ferredoxin oxidoreductase